MSNQMSNQFSDKRPFNQNSRLKKECFAPSTRLTSKKLAQVNLTTQSDLLNQTYRQTTNNLITDTINNSNMSFI